MSNGNGATARAQRTLHVARNPSQLAKHFAMALQPHSNSIDAACCNTTTNKHCTRRLDVYCLFVTYSSIVIKWEMPLLSAIVRIVRHRSASTADVRNNRQNGIYISHLLTIRLTAIRVVTVLSAFCDVSVMRCMYETSDSHHGHTAITSTDCQAEKHTSLVQFSFIPRSFFCFL